MGRRDADEDEGDIVHPAEADAALRFGLSLLLSIVLAAPVLWDVLEGRRQLDYGAMRYLLCFAVARIAVGLVAQLHRTYRMATAPPPAPAPAVRREVAGDLTESR